MRHFDALPQPGQQLVTSGIRGLSTMRHYENLIWTSLARNHRDKNPN